MDRKIEKNPLSILLADDGSEHSNSAIDLVCGLPLPPGSTITVLAVINEEEGSRYWERKDGLDQIASSFHKKGVTVMGKSLFGYPPQVLVNYIQQNQVDLTVLGAKGLRNTPDILLGGVVQQVLENAGCPMLVVRTPDVELHRILMVLDGSPQSQIALEYLAHLPLPDEATIQVVHVVSSDRAEHAESLVPGGLQASDWLAVAEQNGQTLVEGAVETLREAGFKASGEVLRGDVPTQILQFAKKNQVDLIVAGSHGYGWLGGSALGSVARTLLHYGGSSVLIVRGTPEFAQADVQAQAA